MHSATPDCITVLFGEIHANIPSSPLTATLGDFLCTPKAILPIFIWRDSLNSNLF